MAILVVAMMGGAMIAAHPALAFDPPQDRAAGPVVGPVILAQDHRRPRGLYPEDQTRQRALDQMMGHDRTRSAVEAGEIRSLSEIRRAVKRQYAGRIVNVELHERGADMIYDVRVLTPEGNVISVNVDARSGTVMSVKGRR